MPDSLFAYTPLLHTLRRVSARVGRRPSSQVTSRCMATQLPRTRRVQAVAKQCKCEDVVSRKIANTAGTRENATYPVRCAHENKFTSLQTGDFSCHHYVLQRFLQGRVAARRCNAETRLSMKLTL